MGQFDTSAWYIIIMRNEDGWIYSIPVESYNKESAIQKAKESQIGSLKSELTVLKTFYCGQVKPESC